MVVAPAATVARTIWARNSFSVRLESMGENSTSSVCSRASATFFAAISTTSSRSFRSRCRMCWSELDMKTWMRPCAASLIASAARSTAFAFACASAAITGLRTSRAIV